MVVALDGGGHAPGDVGGKAASLDLLVAAGFRVPPAAAVTTRAYERFVRNAGLRQYLDELAGTEVPADIDETQRDVEKHFLAPPMPTEIGEPLATYVEALAAGRHRLAVRSSATAEDMATASFAGQHLSVLEVEGVDAVEEAVRRVWASLWHPAARAYRGHMGIDAHDLSMAVVLQRMVPAERSGVCFTVDPNRQDTLRIGSVEGLGEALVSGQMTDDAVNLSRPGLRPLDGVELPTELREVARTALRIEEELGGLPQDVEWSIAAGEVWVLQARPVTTLGSGTPAGDGFDTTARPGDVYTPSGVSEMLPGVLTPLLWTINGPLVEDGFRRLLGDLGVLPADVTAPYAMVGRFQGQAALNLTRLKEAARRIAGGSGAEVERQYLGHVLGDEPEDRPGVVRRLRNIGPALRALRLRKRAQLEAEVFERAVGEVTALHPDPGEMLNPELLAYRARLRDLAAGGVAAEIAVAVAAVASYRALEVALARWVGDEAPHWAQRITADAAGGTRGAGASPAAIWDVFADVVRDPHLSSAVDGATPDDIEDRLRAVGPAGEEAVARLWDSMERLGSSAVYGGPTWLEQREYVWLTLLGRLAAGRSEQPDPGSSTQQDYAELEAALTRSWRWRLTRVITGQVIDVRRRMLRRLTANARALLRRRETTKAAVLTLGGQERRVARELGRRLARHGAIGRPEHVDVLADWEVEDLVGGGASIRPAEIVRRSDALGVYQDGPHLPAVVHPAGGPVTEAAGDTDAGVRGWGASPGRHRGAVRIVRGLADAGPLRSGEVLVAPATDPSWTPLFLIAGAVVVERGGPLSHAAIVARELGLPAVLNARDVTTRLSDGMVVDVDGSAGTVTPVQPSDDDLANDKPEPAEAA
jgi:phosphohistidine swiveling domain-containing protein